MKVLRSPSASISSVPIGNGEIAQKRQTRSGHAHHEVELAGIQTVDELHQLRDGRPARVPGRRARRMAHPLRGGSESPSLSRAGFPD